MSLFEFSSFQLRVASFRVAGLALCDIPTCFMTCRKWLCVADAILLPCVADAIRLPRFQKMRCICRSRRNILETSHVILRGSRSTLDVSCCVFFANCIVSASRSGDKVQIAYTPHFTLYTPHSTLHTVHFPLHTLHSLSLLS